MKQADWPDPHRTSEIASLGLRRAAADALCGYFIASRKRYERRQRRHNRKAAALQEILDEAA